MTARTVTGKFHGFNMSSASSNWLYFGACEIRAADPNVPVGTFAFTFDDPLAGEGANPMHKETIVDVQVPFNTRSDGMKWATIHTPISPSANARNLRLCWDEDPEPHQCEEMKKKRLRFAYEPLNPEMPWIQQVLSSDGLGWLPMRRIAPTNPFCPYCGERLGS